MRPRLPLVLLLVAFAASRVAYYAAGLHFDASPLDVYWQYVDPELLRDRLLESVWNLHSQPPLYNLFLGVVLKLAGDGYSTAFQAIYIGLGVALTLSLFFLMRRLGAGPWVSALLTGVFVVSPSAALYENWLYVEYAVVVCLVAGGLFLHRFAEQGRALDALVVFSLAAVVVLTRPLFHLAWLLGLVGLMWLLQPRDRRRRVLAAAAIPVALVVGVYAKNFVMFDTVSSTSCSGINAYRVTTLQLEPREVAVLVRQGELSRFALESPFGLPLSMPELFRREPRRGVPLLDRPLKTSGAPNIDHAAYLKICPRYLEDAVTVLRLRPRAFKNAVQEGTFIYWRPTSQYAFFDDRNREETQWIERAFGLVAYGQLRPAKDLDLLALAPRGDYSVKRRIGEVAWFALAAYLTAFAFGVYLLRRAWKQRTVSPLAAYAGYALFNVVWVTLVGIGFEAGENNRFRFLVDPLVLALVAALGVQGAAAGRARRARRSAARAAS